MLTLFWQDLSEWLRSSAMGITAQNQRRNLLRSPWLRTALIFGVVLPLMDPSMGMGRSALWLIAWMALMSMQSITADAFAGQRERGLLEVLFCCPLSNRQILLAKWLAGVCYVTALAAFVLLVNLAAARLDHAAAAPLKFYALALAGVVLLAAPLSAVLCWVSIGAKTMRDASSNMMLFTWAMMGLLIGGGYAVTQYSGQLANSVPLRHVFHDARNVGWMAWVAAGLLIIALFTLLALGLALRRLNRQRPQR